MAQPTVRDIERHIIARVELGQALMDLPEFEEAIKASPIGPESELFRDLRATLVAGDRQKHAAAQGAFVDGALSFCRELLARFHVPWAYLAADLAAGTTMPAFEACCGIALNVTLSPPLRREAISIPQMTIPVDEDLDEVVRRLTEAYSEARRRVDASSLKSGRRPREGGDAIRRGARWWVQHKISGATIGALARGHLASRADAGITIAEADRKAVRKGISETETLMELGVDLNLQLKVSLSK